MGLLSGILGAVAPAIGSFFGGPVGGIIGSAVGAGITGHSAASAASDQNRMNYEMAQNQMDFQREQQSVAHAFSAQQVAEQREWSEKMSNTAYQRGVKDMQSAGLNPMLAYHQGGATTPSSSAPSGVSGGQGARAEMNAPGIAAINTALAAAKTRAEVQKLDAETLVAKAQVPRIEQETKTSVSSAAHLDAQTKTLQGVLPHDIEKKIAEAGLTKQLWNVAIQSEQKTVAEFKHTLEQTKLTKAEIEVVLNTLPRLRNEAKAQEEYSWWMQNIHPFLPDILRGTSSAGQLRRWR